MLDFIFELNKMEIELLRNWVREQHEGQVIPKNGYPYFTHLSAVAALAGGVVRLGGEIGLCHDLLEDTEVTAEALREALLSFGYSHKDSEIITTCVVELTDVYTASAFGELKKNERKQLEAERLITISSRAQSVKYADLIDNIGWVLTFDKRAAKKYLKKKLALLRRLNKGDRGLWLMAVKLIEDNL
ncbi:hypothetical protein GCM10022246_08730 [Pedobacter ginsengiterrae]|uniref:HD domain-containing protein n=2 Tax=Pedobacter ginsengiterrae TaxID=871696 RepID=A0ABP7NZE1_9SPHI